MILRRDFYERDVITVAKELLGKIIVHELPEGITAGRIIETEAYSGPEDRAAHSFGGLRTTRNEVMYGKKGHAYVYLIYGRYYCINITAGDFAGKPEAVMLRALEPLVGAEIMAKRRRAVPGKKANLTNGPGRLCMAMDITKALNKADVTVYPFYIKDAPSVAIRDIMKTTRIGIDYAGEWKNKPCRFYIKGNNCVSIKARKKQ